MYQSHARIRPEESTTAAASLIVSAPAPIPRRAACAPPFRAAIRQAGDDPVSAPER